MHSVYPPMPSLEVCNFRKENPSISPAHDQCRYQRHECVITWAKRLPLGYMSIHLNFSCVMGLSIPDKGSIVGF